MADTSFEVELEQLINKHSVENQSNTPDHILATYILECLQAFNRATMSREEWYGRKNRPGELGYGN
jgi:hypothetical protein